MVSKNIVKLPKSLIDVQISTPWEDVEAKWNEVLNKLATDLELPGFRKGQAPLPMVEQSLGQKLQDEVFKVVFPQALIEALQGSDITPIDYPRYQLVSFAKGQPVNFKALITNKPTVKVSDYKNITVSKPQPRTLTEQDVDKVIEDLFKRWQARQGTGAQNNLSPTNQATNAGSMTFGNTSPGGSQPQVPVVTSSVPDDNFAKALGATDLTDLKIKIKQDLENENRINSDMDYEEAILKEIAKRTEVEIPDILIEDDLHRMLVSFQRNIIDRGLLVDEYLKMQNETLESMRNKWLPQATENVRMELGLAEVARMENIQVLDAEVQAEIDKMQDARLKAQFEAQEPRLHLRHNLRQLKTLDLLKSLVKSN